MVARLNALEVVIARARERRAEAVAEAEAEGTGKRKGEKGVRDGDGQVDVVERREEGMEADIA